MKCIKNTNTLIKGIIIICIIAIIYFLIFPHQTLSDESNLSSSDTVYASEIMEDGKVYTQQIVSNTNHIESFKIKFSTWNVINKSGSIHVIIENEELGEVYNDVIPLEELPDNITYSFYVDLDDMKDKKFIFTMYYEDYEDGNSLSYWYAMGNDETSNLKIDSKETDEVIQIITAGDVDDYFIIWYFVLTISICLALLLIGGKNEEEKSN